MNQPFNSQQLPKPSTATSQTLPGQSGSISEPPTEKKPWWNFTGLKKLSTNPDVLLFGATGKVGAGLAKLLGERCVIPPRASYDFREPKSVAALIQNTNIRYVINAVAMNGMEACESAAIDAMAINSLTPAAIAQACKPNGIIFVHYSSDYAVFMPAEEFTDDNQWASPPTARFSGFKDVYSRSKFRGEVEVTRSAGKTIILRLSSIYTSDTMEGSLSPVKQYLAGKGSKADPIKVIKQFTAPTSIHTITWKTRELLQRLESSRWFEHPLGLTFNMVANEPCWKRMFAWNALWAFCPESKLKDVVIHEGELDLPRPVFSALSPMKLHYQMGIRLPTVMEDLAGEAARWEMKKEERILH